MTLHGRLTLLLVDDDDALREAVSRLARKANYNVLIARDGQDALGLQAQGVHVDIVLSDVEMPGVDGHTVAAAFAASCPVVLMSGTFSSSSIHQLAKPFTAAQLTLALQEALRHHPAA